MVSMVEIVDQDASTRTAPTPRQAAPDRVNPQFAASGSKASEGTPGKGSGKTYSPRVVDPSFQKCRDVVGSYKKKIIRPASEFWEEQVFLQVDWMVAADQAEVARLAQSYHQCPLPGDPVPAVYERVGRLNLITLEVLDSFADIINGAPFQELEVTPLTELVPASIIEDAMKPTEAVNVGDLPDVTSDSPEHIKLARDRFAAKAKQARSFDYLSVITRNIKPRLLNEVARMIKDNPARIGWSLATFEQLWKTPLPKPEQRLTRTQTLSATSIPRMTDVLIEAILYYKRSLEREAARDDRDGPRLTQTFRLALLFATVGAASRLPAHFGLFLDPAIIAHVRDSSVANKEIQDASAQLQVYHALLTLVTGAGLRRKGQDEQLLFDPMLLRAFEAQGKLCSTCTKPLVPARALRPSRTHQIAIKAGVATDQRWTISSRLAHAPFDQIWLGQEVKTDGNGSDGSGDGGGGGGGGGDGSDGGGGDGGSDDEDSDDEGDDESDYGSDDDTDDEDGGLVIYDPEATIFFCPGNVVFPWIFWGWVQVVILMMMVVGHKVDKNFGNKIRSATSALAVLLVDAQYASILANYTVPDFLSLADFIQRHEASKRRAKRPRDEDEGAEAGNPGLVELVRHSLPDDTETFDSEIAYSAWRDGGETHVRFRCGNAGCGEVFDDQAAMSTHKLATNHTDRPRFICTFPFCGKEHRDKWCLENHIINHDPARKRVKFACECDPKCRRTFRSEGRLREHEYLSHHGHLASSSHGTSPPASSEDAIDTPAHAPPPYPAYYWPPPPHHAYYPPPAPHHTYYPPPSPHHAYYPPPHHTYYPPPPPPHYAHYLPPPPPAVQSPPSPSAQYPPPPPPPAAHFPTGYPPPPPATHLPPPGSRYMPSSSSPLKIPPPPPLEWPDHPPRPSKRRKTAQASEAPVQPSTHSQAPTSTASFDSPPAIAPPPGIPQRILAPTVQHGYASPPPAPRAPTGSSRAAIHPSPAQLSAEMDEYLVDRRRK